MVALSPADNYTIKYNVSQLWLYDPHPKKGERHGRDGSAKIDSVVVDGDQLL